MKHIEKVAAVFALILMLSGCAGMSTREQRMLSGGAIGAAGGAAIGAITAGNPATGAAVGGAIGGAVGAVGGYIVDEMEKHR